MSEWEALAILSHAHTVGLEKLNLLEAAAENLKQGRAAEALPQLREVLKFFGGELRTHFAHEEEGLFPVLARVIGPMGPIGVMLDEHQSLWHAVDTLEEHVHELERGPAADLTETQRVATHIVWLLRSHIQKEDQMLFPLAARAIAPEGQLEVVQRMKAVAVSA